MAEDGAASAGEWSRLEAAIVRGFRQLRERYVQRGRTEPGAGGDQRGRTEPGAGGDSPLDRLPVDMQLYIMSFLSPQDLCMLGATSNYWYLMVQDRLLWKYFLLRDFPLWSSTDCHRLLDINILNSCMSESSEGNDLNYMSIYLKSCPKPRKSIQNRHPVYGAMTSFLQSLVMHSEPRFAMFGPGLEQLDDSLVTRMMTSPDLCPVVSLLQRQIDGIGSGVTFQLDAQHKFNILTLYSTTRKERDRARASPNDVANRMFLEAVNGETGTLYSLIPQVKEVCRVVDGFIYVANAEANKQHNRKEEVLKIQAMMDPLMGSQRRPLLVLACVIHPEDQRIPCVYLAHDLCLNSLNRSWMVQNTETSTLSGLLDGIEWLLAEIGKK